MTSYPADNGTVIASNAVVLPVDSLAQTYARNTDGTLASITVVFNGITYVQRYTYTSGALTNVSQWVAQ